MNLSSGGLSWSLGPRGASISIGKRGTFLNSSIPGTGFYSRERIGGSNSSSRESFNKPHVSNHVNVPVTVGMEDDGMIYFHDGYRNPLPEHVVSAAKKQHGDKIRDLIQTKCEEINAQIEALGEIHFYTPDHHILPQFQPNQFTKAPPVKPVPLKPSFWAKHIFKSKLKLIEKENHEVEQQFNQSMTAWQEEKDQFDEAERCRKDMIERGIYADVDAMEAFLEENLQSIVWPRETTVSTVILDSGNRVYLDIDLPELEDMPRKTASAHQRGYKASIKEMSVMQVQRLYMRHVHGIGFRVIGETFSALPVTQQVVLSAYSQRPDCVTGHVTDEYLYSVRVDRSAWSRINFSKLRDLDIVEALTQFDIKRDMTKTGNFKPVKPFSPD
jgi:hypothetical protein